MENILNKSKVKKFNSNFKSINHCEMSADFIYLYVWTIKIFSDSVHFKIKTFFFFFDTRSDAISFVCVIMFFFKLQSFGWSRCVCVISITFNSYWRRFFIEISALSLEGWLMLFRTRIRFFWADDCDTDFWISISTGSGGGCGCGCAGCCCSYNWNNWRFVKFIRDFLEVIWKLI